MISLLHISDYHAGGSKENQPYLRKRVLGESWLRNLDTLQEQGEQWGAGLEPSARALLAQQARGHPYYLSLLGKYLLETDEAKALDRFQLSTNRSLSDLRRHLKAKAKEHLLATLTGPPCLGVSYRARGLVTPEGMPAGQVFRSFLEDQS